MSDDFFGVHHNAFAPSQLFLAVIGSVDSDGATLSFNGAPATQAKFKHVITGQSLAAGNLVLVAAISGSYVIIGKIGN